MLLHMESVYIVNIQNESLSPKKKQTTFHFILGLRAETLEKTARHQSGSIENE